MAITALPTPPSRSDPVNFSTRADAFLGALPAFGTEANVLATEVNANTTTASAAASTATAQAEFAIAAAGATLWISGTNYATGAGVYSPLTLASYRSNSSGVSTVDPSLDTTRWVRLGSSGVPDFILHSFGII